MTIVLAAPNKKPALAISTVTGNIKAVTKEDAVLFIEAAITSIRKVSDMKYLAFKTSDNTHHEAEVDYLVDTIENRLIKALQPKLGFLPQDITAIRTLVTHVCDKERALRNINI